MSTVYAEILSQSKALEGETVRILSDLVRTQSFSTTEKNVVDVIRREMTRAGFDEVRVDGLGNVIGRVGNGKRMIAFDAHVDTVMGGDLTQWKSDPFVPALEDGVIRGRGTVDQKGGMAAMITAGKLIKSMGLNTEFTILFTGTVMEEDCDGLCWQYLIREEEIRPELVVITEPTNMNIYRGHRGRMEIVVKIGGRSCHGSAPERGDNAVYKIARIALEIEKLNERLRPDAFLGKGSVTVTFVHSDSPSMCSVPDGASIQLDRRLTTGETKEIAVAEIRDAAKRAGCDDAIVEVLTYEETAYTGLRYATEKYYPTWVTDERSPYVEHAASAFLQLFGRKPLIDKWTFSTNAVAIAGMHGIPCIGLGPGNEVQAHAPNEACAVEHLSAAAAFYAGLVARMNGER